MIQSYHEHIKYCLSKWESVGNTNNVKINTIRWNKQCNDLRDIYVETRKLVNATSKFIWPLILICCGMNIYFIINKVKKFKKIYVIMLQKILIINICLCSCTVWLPWATVPRQKSSIITFQLWHSFSEFVLSRILWLK